MASIPLLKDLKTKLYGFGAVRPEAWDRIIQLSQSINLKTHQSFLRRQGSLACVAEGLLKEYDAQNRLSPSIINFIGNNQSLVTRKHNEQNYLKACVPTLVYYWDFEDLHQLYQEFRELKAIYDEFCAEYDVQTIFRQRILEEHYAAARVKLFRFRYKALLPLLKKKDMANYVQMSYNHFIKAYNCEL